MSVADTAQTRIDSATPDRVMNRWLVVVGGVLIQLCLGAIYAWSAFTTTLNDATGPFAFTKTRTQVIFSVGLAVFAVCTIIAGRLMQRISPRLVAALGGIVLGVGYVVGGLSGNSFLGMLLGVGVIGGAGIGLAYVVPIAVGVKWFPDKKGLITGLAVAGFGFGATIWVMLASGFGGFKVLLADWGVSADFLNYQGLLAAHGLSKVFMIYGVAFAVLTLIGSIWMVFPPEGWRPAGWTPPTPAKGVAAGQSDFTWTEMLGRPQFFMIWLMFAFGALAGLMVIGIIKLYSKDAMMAVGYDEVAAKGVGAVAMGVFYAIFNGFGRILWGMISDKIGRKAALFCMLLTQGCFLLAFFYVTRSPWAVYIASALVGFNFGGNFALFPAVTADYFGSKHVGSNYGWVFSAYGVGGIVGPIIAGSIATANKDAGVDAWRLSFIIAGVGCLIAAVIALLLRAPKSRAV